MSEKPSNTTEPAMLALAEKLDRIGGDGKLEAREWRIRNRLRWHTKPKSTVRHLLYRERRPTADEAREIEAAYAKWCADRLSEIDSETRQLLASIRQSVAAMEAADPEFFAPVIDEIGQALLRCRMQNPDRRRED